MIFPKKSLVLDKLKRDMDDAQLVKINNNKKKNNNNNN